jgi:hypothetical protein
VSAALVRKSAEAPAESASIPCEVPVPEPAADVGRNVNRVNVSLGSGGSSQLLPRVLGSAGCEDTNSWYYDDNDSPTRIVLCPSTCELAQESTTLDIALGCPTALE